MISGGGESSCDTGVVPNRASTIEPIEVLRHAVASGLPGAPTERSVVLTRDVVAIAGNLRVQGLVWSALQAGALVATDEVTDFAREAHVSAVRSCLLAESWGYEALGVLDAAGVEARALKGLAIAHLDHDDPAERIFGDADLLIRRRDYRSAIDAFEAAGWVRHSPAVRGWWEQRFGKAVVLVPPGGGELDLHLAIIGGYFGELIDHEALWRSTSLPFDLGRRPTVGLDRVGRLVHACCHSVLGGASGLRSKRDVAQLILLRDADWKSAVDQASGWGVEIVLAEAIRATWNELGLCPQHPAARWATDHRPDPRQVAALATYRPGDYATWSSEGRGALPAFKPVDRVRFLAGLAFPSRASLRWRGRSRWAHLRRAGHVVKRSS